jgi:glycosyltransferase involved in cell wall biosynthesis
LIPAIGRYFQEAGESAAEEMRRLSHVPESPAAELSPNDTVLVPEVFFDAQRLAFFRAMSEAELRRYRFIVYDLLPITNPEFFAPHMQFESIFGYFKVVRQASNCGFISEYTRDTYHTRLKRTRSFEGVVLPLGSDSVGARASKPLLDRPLEFSVIGTIEPRKNHQLILEAFGPLLGKVKGLSLTFAGKMGWVDPAFAQKLEALASDKSSGFRFQPGGGDEEIRSLIERSRATIYTSSAEGYGLPPVESLWLGTPVIASAAVPSLKAIGDAGVHYVEPLSDLNIRRAVLAFLDDDYANQKTEETIDLELPRWQSFSDAVMRWCSGE